ncbi:MarR family winged helix-turn-helix transcriptional regulator [Cellulomonas sp. DKR-3]|uniref:MarR family winged helix-turn-helix transcriptional regulator n=1 Tax=Cellulomonas fulva TaxID=2835530 RepID=A0ABS5TZG7_9CELL|nr:MarR family winged helix-turn-helix transcriptional regulator [Cellulomonas fulva]MBT0994553.1 MarR family winged helix-turn-helix transcriptional regulator [Cellulomonas fulva]
MSGRSATPREAAEAWESLFRAQVALMRRFSAEDVWGELSVREYDVLFTLAGCPGGAARLRELAAQSLLTQPSLSRLVERLEARGWVRREPAPDDGRGVVVSLTDEGARLQREVGRRHVAQIHRLVGGALDADELAALRALTDKLRVEQRDIP